MASDRNVVIQGLIDLHISGKGGDEAVASMKQILAQTKQVEAAVGGFTSGTKKAAEGVGTLDKAMASLGRTVAGYFATGALVNFLRDSYIGFARTERQALAVENQIKALGQAADGEGFRTFISDLSRATGILDDDLVPAMQRAVGALKDYKAAQDIVTIAAKFAANGTGDVTTNVEKLTRFFQTGSAKSLVDFGVNLKAGEEAALDLNEGLKLVYEQLGLFPGRLDDAQSRLDSLRQLTDTFADSVGAAADKLAELALKYSMSPLAIAARERGSKATTEVTPEFGPQATAAQLRFAQQQLAIDNKKNEEKSKDALKAEADRLAKVKDLNERNAQEILQAKIAVEAEGTTSRLALELELNERVRAAALENAEAIGADAAAVNKLFDQLAANLVAEREQSIRGGPELGPGAGGEPPEVKAAREKAEATVEWKEWERDQLQSIQDQETQWAVDSAKIQTDAIIQAGSQTGHALAQIFSKRKGFAIGMAIMDTSNAIMQIWADPAGGPWYVKLAKTIAMAAEGAAQIARIRSATVTGGGGGGGTAAASPSTAAYGGAAPPPAFTAGGSGVAPMSSDQMAAMAGRSGGSGGGSGGVTVNIRHAYGDRRSMTKLGREITRVTHNDQGRLR
jgi:hypothetical protein